MKKFLREYRIELLALAAALLGILLINEQLELRAWLTAIGDGFWQGLNDLVDRLLEYIDTFSLSDLAGWLLVISALAFIFWRARRRFVSSTFWRSKACPRCGGGVMRVHRRTLDRLLSATFLPDARRYRCTNLECGWSGLRHHEPRLRGSARSEFPQPPR